MGCVRARSRILHGGRCAVRLMPPVAAAPCLMGAAAPTLGQHTLVLLVEHHERPARAASGARSGRVEARIAGMLLPFIRLGQHTLCSSQHDENNSVEMTSPQRRPVECAARPLPRAPIPFPQPLTARYPAGQSPA